MSGAASSVLQDLSAVKAVKGSAFITGEPKPHIAHFHFSQSAHPPLGLPHTCPLDLSTQFLLQGSAGMRKPLWAGFYGGQGEKAELARSGGAEACKEQEAHGEGISLPHLLVAPSSCSSSRQTLQGASKGARYTSNPTGTPLLMGHEKKGIFKIFSLELNIRMRANVQDV